MGLRHFEVASEMLATASEPLTHSTFQGSLSADLSWALGPCAEALAFASNRD